MSLFTKWWTWGLDLSCKTCVLLPNTGSYIQREIIVLLLLFLLKNFKVLTDFFQKKFKNNHYSRYYVQQCHLLKVMRLFSTQKRTEPGFWSWSSHWSAVLPGHGQITQLLWASVFLCVIWRYSIKWTLSFPPALKFFDTNGSFDKVAIHSAFSIIRLNIG